jgi:hypothetical protein
LKEGIMERTVKMNREAPKVKTHCFELWVDGRRFGPFKIEERAKFATLEHRAGVEFRDVWLLNGWKEKIKKPCYRKDKTTPLFESIDFTPQPKSRR